MIDLSRHYSDEEDIATKSPKCSPKIVKKSAYLARKRRKSSTPNIAQMLKAGLNPTGFFKQGHDDDSPFTGKLFTLDELYSLRNFVY